MSSLPKPFGWSAHVIPQAVLDKFVLKEIDGVQAVAERSIPTRFNIEQETTIVDRFVAENNKSCVGEVGYVKQAPILR